MPDQADQSSARILAPAALAVCAIAFFAVILVSSGGGDDDRADERGERTSQRERRTDRRSAPAGQPNAPTYTVKTGDTVAGIADKTNVPVERIQELNPELDPQALVSGQKIKLRE